MRKPLFAILQYVIFLGAGIFLVWWSIHKLSDKDYAEFIMALKTALPSPTLTRTKLA